MSVSRLKFVTPIGVERMGDLADRQHDPQLLRLENLDTDIRPPDSALEVSQMAFRLDESNSYLPFLGQNELREAAAQLVSRTAGQNYDWKTECIISAGGLSGILNVLLATVEPGDEVLMTDPTYVGLINRVRLAGGVPRFVPLIPSLNGWRLDVSALEELDPHPVRAALLMSPSMPTGAVFNRQEWQALVSFCQKADCWLINDTAMERLVFDGQPVIHPASFHAMRERVITVGSASKEYRMIGWRIGWVVGPASILADVARVSIANVVCQMGIAMQAVSAAIRDPHNGIAESVAVWRQRHDFLMEALAPFQPIPAQGGWSFLINTQRLGLNPESMAEQLLSVAKIAATPMTGWGPSGKDYLRIVYSNESLERLRDIADRFQAALGSGAA